MLCLGQQVFMFDLKASLRYLETQVPVKRKIASFSAGKTK
jgi:hypothetical protein